MTESSPSTDDDAAGEAHDTTSAVRDGPQRASSRRRWWILGSCVVPLVIGLPPLVYFILIVTGVVHPAAWGDFWKTMASPYGTVTAGVAALGAAGIALYNGDQQRQAESERAQHEIDQANTQLIEAKTAADREYQAGVVRDLHTRFTTATNQLAHDSSMTTQQSGAYALGSLADDWLARNNRQEAQVCVDILCSYLRTHHHVAARAENRPAGADYDYRVPPPDQPIRDSILRILTNHLHDGNGAPGPWSHLDLDLTAAHIHDWTAAQAHFTGDTSFRSAHFDGDTSFGGARFDGTTSFSDAHFDGNFRLVGAHFVGDTNFRSAHFDDDTSFSDARFVGTTSFESAQFTGDTSFRSAHFTGNTGFRDARFVGSTGFSGARFVGNTSFVGAQFTRRGTALLGDTILDGVDLKTSASFVGAHFGGTTSFFSARFESPVTFQRAHFGGTTSFDSAHFVSGPAVFADSRIVGTVSLQDARFDNTSIFDRVKFEGMTVFRSAHFDGTTTYLSAHFTGDTEFDGAHFTGDTKFDGSHFTGNTTFQHANFTGTTSYRQVQFTGKTTFQHARFAGATIFESAKFSDGVTDFSDPQEWFGVVADWNGFGWIPDNVVPKVWPPHVAKH